MKEYKAVIFDLDGVICSTDEYHYQAWKTIADELKIPYDRKINDRLRGVSRMESLDIILENYKGAMQQEEKVYYADKKNEQYKEFLKKMSPQDLSSEVSFTLKEIKKAGTAVAIGSSSKNTKLILKQLELSDFFDAVSDGNNIVNSKPHPEVFQKAALYLGKKAADCLVVEDAEAGVKAAEKAGMDCAVLGDAVDKALGTYHMEAFSELLQICNII